MLSIDRPGLYESVFLSKALEQQEHFQKDHLPLTKGNKRVPIENNKKYSEKLKCKKKKNNSR